MVVECYSIVPSHAYAAPPPSPKRISTRVIANPQQLIFSWDPSLEYVCPTLKYDFTSQNCGNCTTNSSQVVSCTEFQTSPAGINCTFTIWSVVCGNVTGPGSMQSANVTLQGYYNIIDIVNQWKRELFLFQ